MKITKIVRKMYETLGIDTAFYGNRVIAWQPLDEEPYREE